MKKAHSLRAYLASAVPELQAAPERLRVFVERGRIMSNNSDSLSFRYAYTMRAVLLDFTADLDVLTVPVLMWLRQNEPDLLANKERRESGVRFDVEVLTGNAVDLSVEIDLTEAVSVRAVEVDGQPRMEVKHLGEIYLPDPYATGDYSRNMGARIGDEWHQLPPYA